MPTVGVRCEYVSDEKIISKAAAAKKKARLAGERGRDYILYRTGRLNMIQCYGVKGGRNDRRVPQ